MHLLANNFHVCCPRHVFGLGSLQTGDQLVRGELDVLTNKRWAVASYTS